MNTKEGTEESRKRREALIKWANPLMGSLERRVLNNELIERLEEATRVIKFYGDEDNYITVYAENLSPAIAMDDVQKARDFLKDKE